MAVRFLLILVVLGSASAGAFDSAAWAAPYDFELAVEDYAVELWYWDWHFYRVMITNTGTEPDTIDVYLAKDLPSGWNADICIRGKCVPSYGNMLLGAGQTDSILVDVYLGGSPDIGLAHLTCTMRHDPSKTATETFATFCALPSIMIVDDDAGAGYESYMQTALEDAGYRARVWDADSLGRPGPVQLASYWAALWTTANGSASYLTTGDEQDMMDYLDGGGNLLLSSMNFLSSRPGPTTFTTDYLDITSWANDTGGGTMLGISGDPISNGMTLPLAGGPFPAAEADNMTLSMPADTVFVSTAGVSGLKIEDSGHKVVFLSFPFEDVSVADPDPNNQATLMASIVDWFTPPVAGVEVVPPGDMRLVTRNFPNPFGTSTTIALALPRGSEGIDIAIYDIEGRLVKRLLDGGPGLTEAQVTWDGTDASGAPVASGVYFYRVTADGASAFRKLVLAR
jgi:hypothetical protein